MTIAAGFVYDDGVLLCADSEMNSFSKALGQKLGAFSGPWGTVGCAFAGNVDFAAGAFYKLQREVENRFDDADEYDGLFDTAEDVLGAYYERHVLSHPRREQDDLEYGLVLVLREPGENCKLYGTQETVVRPVTNFRCTGAGQDFAEYIAKIHFRENLQYSQVLALAAYSLTLAKQNASLCGGPSVFLDFPNSGLSSGITQEISAAHIEKEVGWFEQQARQFFLSHLCSDEEFEKQLGLLRHCAITLRERWTALARPAGLPFPPPSTGGLSDSRPVRDSHEGSDGS